MASSNQNISSTFLSSNAVTYMMHWADIEGDNNNGISCQELANFINKYLKQLFGEQWGTVMIPRADIPGGNRRDTARAERQIIPDITVQNIENIMGPMARGGENMAHFQVYYIIGAWAFSEANMRTGAIGVHVNMYENPMLAYNNFVNAFNTMFRWNGTREQWNRDPRPAPSSGGGASGSGGPEFPRHRFATHPGWVPGMAPTSTTIMGRARRRERAAQNRRNGGGAVPMDIDDANGGGAAGGGAGAANSPAQQRLRILEAAERRQAEHAERGREAAANDSGAANSGGGGAANSDAADICEPWEHTDWVQGEPKTPQSYKQCRNCAGDEPITLEDIKDVPLDELRILPSGNCMRESSFNSVRYDPLDPSKQLFRDDQLNPLGDQLLGGKKRKSKKSKKSKKSNKSKKSKKIRNRKSKKLKNKF